MKMIERLVPSAVAIGVTIFSMVAAPDAAWAEKRVALIVGNSSYETVPQLPNPSRDANSVAKMFRDAGFDSVDVQINVGNLEFKRAIRKFETIADQADIAVVYYAGHGLEIGGTNYLIPVDARLASDRDADDEAIQLERLVASADGAKRLRLVILDACRDNPFVRTMRRERKIANRAISAGLGKVEPTSTDTLIAYAAKAGSTADDGDGQHSPFTSAVLKNLTIPGLDVRLAFGRVRDEVLKVTGNRQEPFVYGSLGGGNVALVPAPVVPQETSVNEVRADYELVLKIGSRRAWEVFLGTHPTGFYADLAHAQIERLNTQPQAAPANVNVAALSSAPVPSSRESSSKEALEWDKVKDSTDPAALQKFITRFPDAPLSINAQQRMDLLKRAAQEREDKARAEREAARRAADQALIQAEQRKAELLAAKKREDDERRAREAEAEQRARAAAAELAATKKREDDERRAKVAEAEQKAKAAEAERKAAEAKQKADEAERNKAAAEAAALRAASEKQAREAEAEQKASAAAAELAATKKREQDERRAKAAEAEQKAKAAEAERKAADAKQKAEEAARNKAAEEAAALRAASEKQAREAEAARGKAELAAAQEANCKKEQGRLEELTTRGSEGSGVDDLKSFSKTVSCDRLGPLVVATLDRFNTEAAKRIAMLPNSPELVRSAQTQLVRLGCLTGKIDGTLNAPTQSALGRYMAIEGQPSENASVTEGLVAELTRHTSRVCPIECKGGETLKGETCVAAEKPVAPATASRRKNDDDEDDARARRKQSSRQPERERLRRPRPMPEVVPHVSQQAVARPSIVSGGGGGHSTIIGVGF
jgi:Caspase domain